MVFIRKGDTPGSTAHDGTDEMIWNSLRFVPPVPEIVAPANGASSLTRIGSTTMHPPARAACGHHRDVVDGVELGEFGFRMAERQRVVEQRAQPSNAT